MKKLLILCLLTLFLGSSIVLAQTLEAEKSHEISKNARKGEIYHFSYNDDTKEYLLIYRRDKKKDYLYDIYKYDYDFNEIFHEEVEGTVETRKKYEWVFPTYFEEEGWNNPKVLRVENNWGGDIVLRKGYLTREWKTKVEDRGSYRYTTRYLKYDFNEEEKIKPKYEGEKAEVDDRAPGFVKKMALAASSKLSLVDYMTDEPTVEVTTGPRSFAYPSIWARTRDYASASGDVVVVASNMQYDTQSKNTIVKYVILKYSAETLDQLKSSEINYDYPTFPMYKEHLSDGSMAFIFAPASYTKNTDPNLVNYHYVRVSKDAEVMDNISFDSPGGPWKIYNISLTNDDAVYIYGQASLKDMKKEPQKVYATMDKFDNLQAMKISKHKIDYITSVPMDVVNGQIRTPSNQKKAKPWGPKDFYLVPEPTITTNGDLIISGAFTDNGALHYFQFDNKGDFKTQYIINTDDPKKSSEFGFLHFLFENPDGTMTMLIPEIKDEKKGQQFRYPKTATIDLAANTISDVNSWGYGKKQEFYLDEGYPTTFINDGNELVFFSRDKSEKRIWFGRIKLGR